MRLRTFVRLVKTDYRRRKQAGEFTDSPRTRMTFLVGVVGALGIPLVGGIVALLGNVLMTGLVTTPFLLAALYSYFWLGNPNKNPDHPANFPEELEKQKSLPRWLRLPEKLWKR